MENQKKSDSSIYETAFERYLNNESISSIARSLGLNRSTLQSHKVRNEWDKKRHKLHMEEFEDTLLTCKSESVFITKAALQIMRKGLLHMNNKPEPPNIDDVMKASKALKIIHDIGKEQKSSTEIFLEQFESSGLGGELEESTAKKQKDIF